MTLPSITCPSTASQLSFTFTFTNSLQLNLQALIQSGFMV
jgi:hypothetical protein